MMGFRWIWSFQWQEDRVTIINDGISGYVLLKRDVQFELWLILRVTAK